MILVLGESIVLTGATAADKQMTAARIGAIVLAVLVTATLWALYFGRRIAAAVAVAGVALLGAALPALATWSLALVVLASVVVLEVRGA